MNTNNKSRQQGLVRMIILIIIAIAVLSWFGIDIKNFFTSPQVQKNFGYVTNYIKDIWSEYLTEPAHKLWGTWIQYIWNPFIEMLQRENHADIITPLE